jgi:hypothetical protein
MTIYCILVTYSRGRLFRHFDRQLPKTKRPLGYKRINVVQPGATIAGLEEPTCNVLRRVPREAFINIKIATGINDITHRHFLGTITPQGHQEYDLTEGRTTPADILIRLKRLKEAFLRVRPEASISFITIPPVDYCKYQLVQTIKRKLFNPVFTTEDLRRSESIHLSKLDCINRAIARLNRESGHQTASWHSSVLKKHKSGTFTFLRGKLMDGLHGNQKAASDWHKAAHHAFANELDW